MIASIKEKVKKIKGLVDFTHIMERNSFVAGLFVLIALISFGLGRLSGLETAKRDVMIEFPENQESAALIGTFAVSKDAAIIPVKTSGTYVASKNGTKYYLPSCGSSNRISPANRVWFDTKSEAEQAGYTPAANCPGL